MVPLGFSPGPCRSPEGAPSFRFSLQTKDCFVSEKEPQNQMRIDYTVTKHD